MKEQQHQLQQKKKPPTSLGNVPPVKVLPRPFSDDGQMSPPPSIDLKDQQQPQDARPPITASADMHRRNALFSLKQFFDSVKQKWAPLLPAKQHWEDEYNFPPGRYAGQGLD
ncbi:hypothetical protein BJY01DRAFT_250593 [Aspergillus pseudoustus]|uniref:Uncharacterized protein n=1 Tax=Aspergillus pseudoustus TaxID=1810923 RepID=A0ABR4JHR0_9EURO